MSEEPSNPDAPVTSTLFQLMNMIQSLLINAFKTRMTNRTIKKDHQYFFLSHSLISENTGSRQNIRPLYQAYERCRCKRYWTPDRTFSTFPVISVLYFNMSLKE